MKTLLFLFALGTPLIAVADFDVPPDVLQCPQESLTVKEGSVLSCYSGDKKKSVEENLLTNPNSKLLKAFYPAGSNTEIFLYPGYEDFATKALGEAFGTFSADAKRFLPDTKNGYNYLRYVVDNESLTLVGPIVLGQNHKTWYLHDSIDPDVKLVSNLDSCSQKNRFTSVAAGGLEIERYEVGMRNSGFQGQCPGNGRPFVAHFSCKAQSTGLKLEFDFKIPSNIEAQNKTGKDPVYLSFKVTDPKSDTSKEVFVKKLSDKFVPGDDYYNLAKPLRPKYLKKPIDVALDAAFDCFDHLLWREKGSAREKAGSGDRFDSSVIYEELKDVKIDKFPDFKKDTEANLKEIKKLEDEAAAALQCPECAAAGVNPTPSPTPAAPIVKPKTSGKSKKSK